MNFFATQKPLAAAIALVSASVLQPAFATPTLEEVIVTAQKREQSLQDVPVAVTAFDASALKEAGVLDITELQRSSPNTTLQTSRGTNSTLTAYIRGIGQADPLWGFEPGVGLYVDDVYIARPQAGVLDVYDVDRIEVLRGPQGTLYGKNTIGGAIKYVTKRMTGEPELTVNVGVGSYNQRDLKIAGQLPISDQLVLGASVARLTRDGYGSFLNSGADNYNKDVSAARLSLEFTPSDELFIRIAADTTEDDSNAKGGHRMVDSLQLPNEKAPSNVYDTYADLDTANSVESAGVSLSVEWDINESLQLKSISAYREGETRTNIDFDNTSLASLHVPASYDDDQLTQEFQLSYGGDQLNVVGGLYYYEGTAAGAFDVMLGAYDSLVAPYSYSALSAGSVDTTSYAAYINAAYDISEQLSMTLGGRYTIDKKDASVYKAGLGVVGSSSFTGGETMTLLSVATDYSNGDSWKQFSPRVSLDYQINDDVMVYASYSEGFKSGGFDMRGDAAQIPSTVDGFDPETVETWELGIKTELFDSRLRLNAALFSTDYKDMQVTVQTENATGSAYKSNVLNAGSAAVDGFELEAVGQITEALSLTASVGYINAEYNEVMTETAEGPVDLSDEWEFAFTPEWTGSLSLRHRQQLDDMGSLSLMLAGSYRAETRAFPNAASMVDEGSYVLMDASAVWSSADEHWSVGLHGKNLTGEEYRVGGYNFPSLGGEASIIGYYGNPRTVTLDVGYNF